jgi:hypothetical protein
MKFLSYVFVIAVATLSFNLNASVAKPKNSSKNTPLPAIWSSTTAQERLKALRVAQLDAYRALLERVYGFQISSGTTVYDCALQSDKVHTQLNLLLKGATELEKPEYNDKGMVMVVYGLKLRKIIDILKVDKSFDTTTITKGLENQDKIIEALGCGALPDSMGMKMLRAKRAAELDAYRLMAERLTGVKVNSETTIADMCLKNDNVQASLVAFLKGLKPTAINYKSDGACSVTMQLKIREVVKTVESLVRVYNSDNKDKITNIKIATNDKIFTVTGNGAPRDNVVVDPSNDIYHSERTILRTVLKREIVVE